MLKEKSYHFSMRLSASLVSGPVRWESERTRREKKARNGDHTLLCLHSQSPPLLSPFDSRLPEMPAIIFIRHKIYSYWTWWRDSFAGEINFGKMKCVCEKCEQYFNDRWMNVIRDANFALANFEGGSLTETELTCRNSIVEVKNRRR